MADDPAEAGTPRTKDATRVYDEGRIQVHWDATLCIHTALCLKLLPQVFDVTARPWVDVTGAPPEDIAATVEACPTGALRYDGPGVQSETPAEPTTIEARPNGPLFVRGRVQLQGPRVQDLPERYRMALCRCGASENKPFCDNSHRLVGFRTVGSAGRDTDDRRS